MTAKEFLEICRIDKSVKLLDGYDNALIGFTDDYRAIYNYDLMTNCLGDMCMEDAMEWINHNVIRCLPYMGEGAPIVMYPLKREV